MLQALRSRSGGANVSRYVPIRVITLLGGHPSSWLALRPRLAAGASPPAGGTGRPALVTKQPGDDCPVVAGQSTGPARELFVIGVWRPTTPPEVQGLSHRQRDVGPHDDGPLDGGRVHHGRPSDPARSPGNRSIALRGTAPGRSRDRPDQVRDPAHPEVDVLLDDIAGPALKMAERWACPVPIRVPRETSVAAIRAYPNRQVRTLKTRRFLAYWDRLLVPGTE